MRDNITHADGCTRPPVIVRPEPTEHGDRVQWCPGCMRGALDPVNPPTHQEEL